MNIGFALAITNLPAKSQSLFLIGERLRGPTTRQSHDPQIAQASGLAPFVAQVTVKRQRLLKATRCSPDVAGVFVDQAKVG